MTTLVVRPSTISGRCTVPGNKSISHRALMLGAMAKGTTVATGLGPGADVRATIDCLRAFGVAIDDGRITSPGIAAWRRPGSVLDCANSGTTMRVLAGLAARCAFTTTLDGDASLRRRPMDRVAAPLRILGADVRTTDGHAPVTITGAELSGAAIVLDVASAQVKTAAILAALGASGETVVTEPVASRDHTERMLRSLGAPIDESFVDGAHVVRVRASDVPAFETSVPGDVSSAAFLVAAAILTGEVQIDNVGLNPTRTSFVDVVKQMGADVTTEATRDEMGEPVGTIVSKRSALRGVAVDGSDPGIQDELPLVALLATQADGETTVKGAHELRVKESDRIDSVVRGLRALGAEIHELVDGFVVRGPTKLRGAEVDPSGDHRIAMMLAVAGSIAEGETRITDFGCADVSWPGFVEALRELGADV
jgi:3-phosphoshikimate 1-carboxyvinyltransferase